MFSHNTRLDLSSNASSQVRVLVLTNMASSRPREELETQAAASAVSFTEPTSKFGLHFFGSQIECVIVIQSI